ncbi:pituitary tumor-transforming gene 1 protein-interacting protein isoform X1 [Pungitius pungitius]|uniref:pituitary tumor-transforming gene 1 protein-interacting protein isoform X1 n=1 Tax=Pungitius pungitius TaxID=134920 RepID=UPI0018884A21|nr:pituitary tumor-transforming gene 1 protein-interacting protein isoform X1 [Pungitius pungitius]
MSLSKKEGHRTLTSSLVLGAFMLFVSFVSRGECQTTPPPTPCSSYKSCDQCAPNTKCLWCFTTNNCTDYPVSWLLPPPSLCPLSQARWGMCWLNFEGLIIALAVLGGTALVSIVVCCCCCCCCCKKRSVRPDRDEERLVQRREENKQRTEERNVERKARHDQIRKKYGLMSDSDHPYSKFENE